MGQTERRQRRLEMGRSIITVARITRITRAAAFRSNNKTSLDAGEWVSALVREMQSASSVNDAEHRATNVLRAFEESTLEQAEIEIKRIRKQNELLKRAVTIQNAIEAKRRRRADAEKTSCGAAKHVSIVRRAISDGTEE